MTAGKMNLKNNPNRNEEVVKINMYMYFTVTPASSEIEPSTLNACGKYGHQENKKDTLIGKYNIMKNLHLALHSLIKISEIEHTNMYVPVFRYKSQMNEPVKMFSRFLV